MHVWVYGDNHTDTKKEASPGLIAFSSTPNTPLKLPLKGYLASQCKTVASLQPSSFLTPLRRLALFTTPPQYRFLPWLPGTLYSWFLSTLFIHFPALLREAAKKGGRCALGVKRLL